MTEEQYKKLPTEDAIKLINMCIGVGQRKVTGVPYTTKLVVPFWTHPEADAFLTTRNWRNYE